MNNTNKTGSKYLNEIRIESLKKYVAEVSRGSDSVKAWNDHKARTGGR